MSVEYEKLDIIESAVNKISNGEKPEAVHEWAAEYLGLSAKEIEEIIKEKERKENRTSLLYDQLIRIACVKHREVVGKWIKEMLREEVSFLKDEYGLWKIVKINKPITISTEALCTCKVCGTKKNINIWDLHYNTLVPCINCCLKEYPEVIEDNTNDTNFLDYK